MLWSYVASGTFGRDVDPTAGLCRPPRYSADASGAGCITPSIRDGQNGNSGYYPRAGIARWGLVVLSMFIPDRCCYLCQPTSKTDDVCRIREGTA